MRDTEGCHDGGDDGDGDGNEKENYYMDGDNNGNAENRNDNDDFPFILKQGSMKKKPAAWIQIQIRYIHD